MLTFDGTTALENMRRSRPKNIWAIRNPNEAEKDHDAVRPGMGGARVYTPDLDLLINPKFTLSRDDSFFCVGSCFARNIEVALKKQGFDIKSWGPDAVRPPKPWLFNRYNSFSMKHDFELAFTEADPTADFVEFRGHWFDHTGLGKSDDKASLTSDKAFVIDTYKTVREATVLVLTLGLVEVWYDRALGKYLNFTPEAVVADPQRYEVRIADFQSNLEALEDLLESLERDFGCDLKVICTVSPVPLLTTFTDRDVIVANSYSKSVLRAVAETLASTHPNVDYFPSYELATLSHPDTVWQPDRRHVRPDFVDQDHRDVPAPLSPANFRPASFRRASKRSSVPRGSCPPSDRISPGRESGRRWSRSPRSPSR